MLARIQHRMMFNGRGDDVVARCRQSKYRQIVGFGPSTGEDHFRRPASQKIGYRLARALDRRPRLLSMVMDGRRVSKTLAKVRLHRLKNFRQYRRAGIVVEINPAHIDILRRTTASIRPPAAAIKKTDVIPKRRRRRGACCSPAAPGQPRKYNRASFVTARTWRQFFATLTLAPALELTPR